MRDRDTISIHLVHEALRDCLPATPQSEAWLSELGIDRQALADPAARLGVQHYARLWRRLAARCNDEFFGMDRRGLPPGSFAFMCQASVAQATLGEALGVMLTFLGLMLDGLNARIVRHGPLAELVLDEGDRAPRRAFAYFTLWLMVHGLACWLAGRRLPILAIDLRGEAPAYCNDYRVLFTERLKFRQPTSRLVIPADCLELVPRRNPVALSRFLAKAPGNLLVRYRDPDSLGLRVRHHLQTLDPSQWPNAAALAQRLHLSLSTLRRRLSDEGQSYQGLKDSVRRELALAWLADGQPGMAGLGAHLGFADESSFYRAFRKWFGCNPGHYRTLFRHGETVR